MYASGFRWLCVDIYGNTFSSVFECTLSKSFLVIFIAESVPFCIKSLDSLLSIMIEIRFIRYIDHVDIKLRFDAYNHAGLHKCCNCNRR